MPCAWSRDRENTPIVTFFARIVEFLIPGLEEGGTNTGPFREAVAYIGFAGTLNPGEADQPIAICKESITDNTGQTVECNIGRMFNSEQRRHPHTAGWTDFRAGS